MDLNTIASRNWILVMDPYHDGPRQDLTVYRGDLLNSVNARSWLTMPSVRDLGGVYQSQWFKDISHPRWPMRRIVKDHLPLTHVFHNTQRTMAHARGAQEGFIRRPFIS